MANDFADSLRAGFEVGSGMVRSFTETRALFQDRAQKKTAQEVLAQVAEQEKSISNAEMVAHERLEQLHLQVQNGDNPDPKLFQSAVNGLVVARLKGTQQRQNLYMGALAANPGNPYIERTLAAQVEANMASVNQMNSLLAAETQREVSDEATERTRMKVEGDAALQAAKAGDARALERLKHNFRGLEIAQKHSADVVLAREKAKAEGKGPESKMGTGQYDPADWLRGAENAFLDAQSFVDNNYSPAELEAQARAHFGVAEGEPVTEEQVGFVKKSLLAYHHQEILARNGLLTAEQLERVGAGGSAWGDSSQAPASTSQVPEPAPPRSERHGELELQRKEPMPAATERMPGEQEQLQAAGITSTPGMEEWFDYWRAAGQTEPPIGASQAEPDVDEWERSEEAKYGFKFRQE